MDRKNCFFKNSSCQNCNLDRLYSKYSHIIPCLTSITNCYDSFRVVAQFLCSVLSRTPNSAYDADAYVLISTIKSMVSDDDLPLAMRLCSAAIQSKLFLGLTKHTIMEASIILLHFEMYLDRFGIISAGEGFDSFYCNYYSVKFQLVHLTGDYSSVTKEYENRLVSDDIILQRGSRIVSQYTASKWVGSSSKIERIQSRDVAEELMGDVQKKEVFNGDDYFIIAKYLEHHIQDGTPGDGLKEVLKYLGSPSAVEDIASSHEAVNQAILYRDLYEASKKSWEDEKDSLSYLRRANRIVDFFNLRDQENKIRGIKETMREENSNSKYNISGSQVVIVEGDLEQPIIYNPPSGFDISVFKQDITKLIDACDEDAKNELCNALKAIDARNESKFKKALKQAFKLCRDIFVNISSEALIAYMRQNGLMPQ